MGQPTLFIAAGHGGKDRGNVATRYVERDETIDIVAGARSWYRQRGIPQALGGAVFLADSLDLVGEISALTPWRLNDADGDLALDIHLDYKPGGSGALILYDESAMGRRFAQYFLPRWCALTGIRSNGVFRSKDVAGPWRGWPDFGFCAQRGPGCIIELGHINNEQDMRAISSPDIRVKLGQLIWESWRVCLGEPASALPLKSQGLLFQSPPRMVFDVFDSELRRLSTLR